MKKNKKNKKKIDFRFNARSDEIIRLDPDLFRRIDPIGSSYQPNINS